MIKLKPNIILALIACMMTVSAFARQLSVDEALSKIPRNLLSSYTRSVQEQVFTESIGDLNVAYVVSMPNAQGYVVVGADDLLPPILGYSDNGGFDAESIPPAMKYWLSEYGRQLAYAESHGFNIPNAMKIVERETIAPLCDATWSQSRPFNDNCPTINGKNAPAGCTATAMAQVMYAHKWPMTGTGDNTYVSGTTREKMYFDFGSTTFDWANMLPSYSSQYSASEGAAVATLLEACGNAALMSYGASASGAYPYDAIFGMVKFMRYDKSALLLERDYYNSELWNDLVYSELAKGRPVIYGGYDSSYQKGHTFIVDGYNGDGYYHLNWGWGGKSNGYFLLTGLDPAEEGIGGSGAGYNFRQNAIIYVMPASENSAYQLEITWDGSFSTVNKAYTPMGEVDFIVGNDGEFTGFTLVDTKAKIGVNLTPEDGGDTVFYPAAELDFSSHYGEYSGESYKKITIPVSDFPKDGTYIVTPAYEHNGSVKGIKVKVGNIRSLIMTCSTRGVKFETPDVSRTLTADNIKVLNKLYSGKSCTVTAEIHNSGEEYLGMVKAGFENAEGQVRTWLKDVPVNITDGGSVNVVFNGVLNSYNSTLAPGKYLLNIFDESGESICAKPITVEVSEAPTGRAVYDITMEVSNCSAGDGTKLDPYLIGDDIDLDVKISVTSGLVDDIVALYAYYDDNSELDFSDTSTSYRSFFVSPGDNQSCRFNLGTSDFELDKMAYIRAYGWKTDWSGESLGWIGRYVYVKRTSSGVGNIDAGKSRLFPNPVADQTTAEAASNIKNVEVYSLMGNKMLDISGNGSDNIVINVSNLQPGHYIVRVNTENGVDTHRMIKK